MRITLDHPVPTDCQDEVLRGLSWVDDRLDGLAFDPQQTNILELRGAASLPTDVVSRLRGTANRLARSLAIAPPRTIYRNATRPPGIDRPYDRLCERGWVTAALAGTHVYSGRMLALYRALDAEFRREALALGASEHQFPTLIDIGTLRCTGYLDSFAQHANLLCHVPEQLDAVRRFRAQTLECQNCDTIPNDGLAPADCAASPTVCYHFYRTLAGRTIGDECRSATAVAPCYRYEGRPAGGLHRLREFNMREIICVGTPEQVTTQRGVLMTLARQMLERFGIDSLICTASDPFFMDEADRKRLFQVGFDLKHEARAHLPRDDSWIAIGSINYHQDHFGRAFDIRTSGGEPAHSCCLGFGLDRWCLAVFAQYGLEPQRWPSALADLLKTERIDE